MVRLVLCYALSGFLALGYQVAWFRLLADWFGATTLVFALVVGNFIAGLGTGAFLSRRLAAAIRERLGIREPLRTWGVVEAGVALAAAATLLVGATPPWSGDGFPYELVDGVWQPGLALTSLQVLVAALVIFVPCALMGVSYPLLCEAYVGVPGTTRFPALLYASNTFGACAAVLACQFVLIPWLGHGAMFRWLLAGNGALAAYLLLARDRAAEGAVTDAQLRGAGPPAGSLVLAATLSGLLCGAVEGDVFKRVSFLLVQNPGATMSFISFWAVLGIFLASAWVRRSPGMRLIHIRIVFALAALWYVAVTQAADSAMSWVQSVAAAIGPLMGASPERGGIFPGDLWQLFAFCGLLILPPYLLLSTLLPWACSRIHERGGHLGLAYGSNVLAFCAGLIAFTLVAPGVSIFYSTKLIYALLIVGTALLWLVPVGRPLPPWPLPVAAVVLAAAAILVPARFDPRYFTPDSLPARFPVLAMRSNGNDTILAVERGSNLWLYFGRMSMSGTNFRSQAYMRLMAHFPLLLHPDPRKALLICFGVGNTASAIAAHETIEQIDAVDLNDDVFALAYVFAPFNAQVFADSRTRLIHDDGRHYLERTGERYDLITSEPPPPLSAGAYRLYSREYYEAARDRLTGQGLLSQWLPVYQMPEAAVALAVATFLEVFPHAMLITGYDEDFILIGSRAPFDLSQVPGRLAGSRAVRTELAAIEIHDAVDLVAHVVQTDADLRRHYRAPRLLSDQHNDLEHMVTRLTETPAVAYSPVAVLTELRRLAFPAAEQAESLLMHPGRLRFHVAGFPIDSLATVREMAGGLSDSRADWPRIERLVRLADEAQARGNGSGEAALLGQALEHAPEQPEILRRAALVNARLGATERAAQLAAALQALEPGSPAAAYWSGRVAMALGRGDLAVEDLTEALRRSPDWPPPMSALAWVFATHPRVEFRQPGRARQLAQRAVELTRGRDVSALASLAAASAAAGDHARAATTIDEAIRLNAPAPVMAPSLLAGHAVQYRQGRAVVDRGLASAEAVSATPPVTF